MTTGPATYTKSQGATVVSAAGMTVTQTFLNGFQTANRTRQAEGQVFAAREIQDHRADRAAQRRHRLHELLRDAAILELQRSNVNVLEVTLRQTRDRFNAGEVTRTDVAQANRAWRKADRSWQSPSPTSSHRGRSTRR